MTMTPSVVDDTDGPVTIAVSAHVVDNLAGFTNMMCTYVSPSGTQRFGILVTTPDLGATPVVDGVVTSGVHLDANWAQPGVWHGMCLMFDAVGNSGLYSAPPLTFL